MNVVTLNVLQLQLVSTGPSLADAGCEVGTVHSSLFFLEIMRKKSELWDINSEFWLSHNSEFISQIIIFLSLPQNKKAITTFYLTIQTFSLTVADLSHNSHKVYIWKFSELEERSLNCKLKSCIYTFFPVVETSFHKMPKNKKIIKFSYKHS